MGVKTVAMMMTVGLAVAACSADSPAADVETATSPDSAAVMTHEMDAVDYAYENLPERAKAGDRFLLNNRSDVEAHSMVFFLVPDSATSQDLDAIPPEEVGQFMNREPTVVIATAPGSDEQVCSLFCGDGDETGIVDTPGTYLVVDTVPTGADPQEFVDAVANNEPGAGPPRVDGGEPHFLKGQYGWVVVE